MCKRFEPVRVSCDLHISRVSCATAGLGMRRNNSGTPSFVDFRKFPWKMLTENNNKGKSAIKKMVLRLKEE